MPMTSTVTLTYEGAPACQDCQRNGVPVCAHVGFNPEAWNTLPGSAVYVPGLDPAFLHTATAVEISADRKIVTLTIATDRPALLDLARHLSVLAGPKAMVRTVHADTGTQLTEGGYDAPLQLGQPVWINGDPFMVTTVEHPYRDPDTGVVLDGHDWQVATLAPVPLPEPIAPLPEPAEATVAMPSEASR